MSTDNPHQSEIAVAADLARDGRVAEAISAFLRIAGETPGPDVCLKLARCYESQGDRHAALRWALAVADDTEDFTSWQAAIAIARRNAAAGDESRTRARLALLGSYTTNQLAAMLWLAARRIGIELELYEAPYGQYRQEILDPSSAMSLFAPDLVVLAVHDGELALPAFSSSPDTEVAKEVERWRPLWRRLGERSNVTVIQHLFAIPPFAPFGHFGATLAGTRVAMAAATNAALAVSPPDHVAFVDCERLASLVGKRRWFEPRYWHLAKQAVALDALPVLARHTAAVIASRLGLGKKCLVLDLDNTLWGGIIGEDGIAGIQLGDTPDGEAFQAFQEAVLALRRRGIVLAVCSRNNLDDARVVFEQHPEMRIRLDDIATFVADWRPKPEQIASVAAELGLGLETMVFIDDNPAEREAVRQFLPEVDVITLPREPAGYVQAVADYLLFEPAAFTTEDRSRTELYRARSAAAASADSAESIEGFYRSLEMRAVVSPFTDDDLPRIAQLVGKTNQFNLTTRRHSLSTLRRFAEDPSCVTMSFRLADKFVDHGLIAVVVALQEDAVLVVDSWLMSCRVIGRTLEATILQELCAAALDRGCSGIRGSYIPTAKNELVKDLFPRLGFKLATRDGVTGSVYDLRAKQVVVNPYIEVVKRGEGILAGA